MLCGLDGKTGNQNVEMKKTQKHSGCFGGNDCLIFGFAETKSGWPEYESCLTSKSSIWDRLHKHFQPWLTSVLNKQSSSLGTFQPLMGWQHREKDLICLTSVSLYGCISLKAEM